MKILLDLEIGSVFFVATVAQNSVDGRNLKKEKACSAASAARYLVNILTLGTLSCKQIPSCTNRSLISQAKMDGHSDLYRLTESTTSEVATRGFEPPIAFGRMDPVS